MISLIMILTIVTSTIILSILSYCILALGALIAKTPDGEERKGIKIRTAADKGTWHSPENMPKHLIRVFVVTHIIGCVILILSQNIAAVVVGVIVVFTAMFFSAMIVYTEFIMYSQMSKNNCDFAGSWCT